MYNKLFTKILDSSIWLESMPTRIVWLTLIAAMDESGFCQFASVANVAHRARVGLQEAEEAMACLEGPDENSGDPENQGRRLERVPGGWLVLNAEKHRAMVSRAIIQEQTRERVRKHRSRRAGNASVTEANETVTPSEAEADTETRSETEPKAKKKKSAPTTATRSSSIVSPAEYDKLLKHHSYVGARLRVPHKLHNDFIAILGGTEPDTRLREWYDDVDEEIEASGESIVPNIWKWLTARFEAWAGDVAEAVEWAKIEAWAKEG